jgi:hypothetical protein
MSVTRDELAAFADGELDEARATEIAAAVAADPALEAQLDAHRALKARLGAHFAPILDAPVPDRLSALLESHTDTIVSFTLAKERRERARTLPRWGWFAGPALAASLALAVLLPRGGDYAERPLADTLDGQLASAQAADAPTRILLSFRDASGDYCRAFAGESQSGIACRDDAGWRLRFEGKAAPAQEGEFRMAGTPAADVLRRAQDMAAGPALDAEQERAAKARGWR